MNVDSVHAHILCYGFLPGYTTWTFHGENDIPSILSRSNTDQELVFGQDDIIGLVNDAFGTNFLPLNNTQGEGPTFEGDIGDTTQSFDQPEKNISYKKLLEECDNELYPWCKYSNLSFTLCLYHLKCIGNISNKAFGMLLELLRDAFPHLTSLPSSVNEAKKLTKDLGLGYEKIDACPNDCMLYRGDRLFQKSCHICKASRYKSDIGDEAGESSRSNKSQKPAKVFRYFPLIPGLKRLYMSEKTTKEMSWHDNGLTKDGKLRHPADGLSWKVFDARYPKFASDPRSVRLGLASDGFNLFRKMSTTYSTWPAYDAFSKERFKLRAALLWTVNDFPAYANLSGWSTKGRVACPTCMDSTRSIWLKHGKKFCYMGHSRWLEKNHNYRFQKELFDGTVEHEGPPNILKGSDILQIETQNQKLKIMEQKVEVCSGVLELFNTAFPELYGSRASHEDCR